MPIRSRSPAGVALDLQGGELEISSNPGSLAIGGSILEFMK